MSYSRVAMIVMACSMAQAQPIDRSRIPSAPPANDQPGSNPDTMPRILNDTREYCDVLRQDIARIRVRLGELPAEPALLAREGERMCQMGHFRPGIYRLRSALMMLRP